jgi:hypothetical protein
MKELKKRLQALTKEILSGQHTLEDLAVLREEVRTIKELILAHKAYQGLDLDDDETSERQPRTSGDFSKD